MNLENLLKQRDSSMNGLDDTRLMRERESISRSGMSQLYDSNNILKNTIDDLSNNSNTQGRDLTSITNNQLNHSKTENRYRPNDMDSMSNDLESIEAGENQEDHGYKIQYRNTSYMGNNNSFQKINKRQYLTNSEINVHNKNSKKMMDISNQSYRQSFKKPIEQRQLRMTPKTERSTKRRSPESSFLVSKKNLSPNVNLNTQDESFLRENINISKIPTSHGNEYLFYKIGR